MTVNSVPLPSDTADIDLAVMQLDQFLGDGQTQSGSAEHARSGHVNAVEAVEYPRQMLLVDAKSGVGHLDIDIINQIADIDLDLTAPVRILDRVADQVGDDPLHGCPVNIDEGMRDKV